jgi:hypothetical protein
MRVSSIEFEKDVYGEISYRHFTDVPGAPDEEDFFDDGYYNWKRTKDKGVRHFRDGDSADENGYPTRLVTVAILETSPLFNIQVIDDMIEETRERSYINAPEKLSLFMLRFLGIPLLRSGA